MGGVHRKQHGESTTEAPGSQLLHLQVGRQVPETASGVELHTDQHQPQVELVALTPPAPQNISSQSPPSKTTSYTPSIASPFNWTSARSNRMWGLLISAPPPPPPAVPSQPCPAPLRLTANPGTLIKSQNHGTQIKCQIFAPSD